MVITSKVCWSGNTPPRLSEFTGICKSSLQTRCQFTHPCEPVSWAILWLRNLFKNVVEAVASSIILPPIFFMILSVLFVHSRVLSGFLICGLIKLSTIHYPYKSFLNGYSLFFLLK
jgi:hypothetical protein